MRVVLCLLLAALAGCGGTSERSASAAPAEPVERRVASQGVSIAVPERWHGRTFTLGTPVGRPRASVQVATVPVGAGGPLPEDVRGEATVLTITEELPPFPRARPATGLRIARADFAADGSADPRDRTQGLRHARINGRRLTLSMLFGSPRPTPRAIAAANQALQSLRVGPPPAGARPLRVTTNPVGASPSTVAVGEGAVWVGGQGGVVRIDPRRDRVVARVDTGPLGTAGPCGLAVGPGAVWVAIARERVLRIDPAANRVIASISLPGAGCAAVAAGRVWAAAGRSIRRIDPATNLLTGPPIPVRGRPQGVAAGPGGVWVASGFGDARSQRAAPTGTTGRPVGVISRIDPRTGAVALTREVVAFPEHVATGSGQVWLTSDDGTAARLDPDTGALLRRARVSLGGRTRLAVGLGGLWGVTEVGPGTAWAVRKLDSSGRRGPPVPVGASPVSLAVGAGAVWVANLNDGTVTRIDP